MGFRQNRPRWFCVSCRSKAIKQNMCLVPARTPGTHKIRTGTVAQDPPEIDTRFSEIDGFPGRGGGRLAYVTPRRPRQNAKSTTYDSKCRFVILRSVPVSDERSLVSCGFVLSAPGPAAEGGTDGHGLHTTTRHGRKHGAN